MFHVGIPLPRFPAPKNMNGRRNDLENMIVKTKKIFFLEGIFANSWFGFAASVVRKFVKSKATCYLGCQSLVDASCNQCVQLFD